ncbi:hypothetical protein GLAREA_12463 [Glarea lozoyensis ATCC 20868]|uniref:Uncharacterized protein n=2 Tax=Glarea lozoyensis TaxID=101852 RepID=S3CZL7_GLAL2|nr:uncharacterized protein GLAREA_12463 [Glarea lozoyensis ATCC 20868]EHL02512.1 hypothetical protein M7I_1593 [Glarea lozoyensis 74030]EPE31707.1 hypothetical protein GLAREA_12463 [Glarea lozoyensis ATCC 20868]
MKFSIASLLSLATAVSAIDIYLHPNTDCSGTAGVCAGAGPRGCCTGPGGAGSASGVALRGIPIGWLVELQGFTGGGCTNFAGRTGSGGGTTFLCLRGGFFTGAGYIFYGKKRDETAEVDDKKCQRFNILRLADGTEYDVSGLNDEVFDSLLPIGLNATTHEEVPNELKTLRIE